MPQTAFLCSHCRYMRNLGKRHPSRGQRIPQPSTANSQKSEPRESPATGGAGDTEGTLSAHSSTALREMKIERTLPSRVGSAEQSNSSILYGDALILKLFRRMQPGENPDVEIGKFLTEVAHFDRIAAIPWARSPWRGVG